MNVHFFCNLWALAGLTNQPLVRDCDPGTLAIGQETERKASWLGELVFFFTGYWYDDWRIYCSSQVRRTPSKFKNLNKQVTTFVLYIWISNSNSIYTASISHLIGASPHWRLVTGYTRGWEVLVPTLIRELCGGRYLNLTVRLNNDADIQTQAHQMTIWNRRWVRVGNEGKRWHIIELLDKDWLAWEAHECTHQPLRKPKGFLLPE